MIYGYARVSSAGQAIDGNSLEAQSELLKANGAQKIFSDVYTGTKLHRPELDKLMAEIQPGDTLIVAKLDRIARSAKNGLELIDQFIDKGVSVNINSNKPTAGRTKAIHRRLELSCNLYLLLLFVGQNRASKSHLHITLRISRFLQFFNK